MSAGVLGMAFSNRVMRVILVNAALSVLPLNATATNHIPISKYSRMQGKMKEHSEGEF